MSRGPPDYSHMLHKTQKRMVATPVLSKLARHSLTSFTSTSTHTRRLTKKSCISLLQRCSSMKQLKQVHCQMLATSLHRSGDVVEDLLVFCTHPDSGDLSYAATVFETLEGDPSLFLYNLMIKAFTKKNRFDYALMLFYRMRNQDVSPDNFTYPLVLKSMAGLSMASDVQKTHVLIVKSGFEFDRFTRISLVDVYSEMGHVEMSRTLFDETPEMGVISWNVMIGAYVKCRKFEDAISVYQKMVREGVKPDEATLVITVSACSALGNLELGTKLHVRMHKELWFSVTLGNALLDMYTKCGPVDVARRFFDSMPTKNVVSWTSMVSGYVKCGELDKARQLFDRSPGRDVVLWTALINGYVQCNRFDEALATFREMQSKGIKPDKFMVVSLLTACARLGALEQGRLIHGYIQDNRIQLDAVVGTALIDMYAKCGCIDKSLEVFSIVERRDTTIWTSIIYGLATNGESGKALELFSEMRRAGAKPDDITFISVLSACSHGGLVNEGRRFFHAMKEMYRMEPKLEHYGCFIDLLGRAGLLDEAEGLIRNIPKGIVKDVLPLWGSLLGACRIHGNVEMGDRLAKQMLELESGNSGAHALIANIYAAAERWEDVKKIRRKMKDWGIKKTPGCSSVEVNGARHEFLVGDSSFPETGEI
ncbi:pentatricopeptide repeat-containing protein At1g31430-like [Musa acuminata AAA Group]|uniref:pentatricopeptide repeat-containing protein At1g31430-like n=1 Tax=Musa acuminata AAA Group TaxID=214697 RepID=UPI0031CE8109